MPARKSSSTKSTTDSPENPIEIIKEARCKSLEGSAHLTYQIGHDKAGEICFRITKNSGGGFFSNEWVEYWVIERALLEDWPKDKPITSMALRGVFRGKSVNTPSFLMAVLREVGFLEPVPGRKRVHQAVDPLPVLAKLEGGSGAKPKKKPARKTPAKAKAKAAPRKKAPAKSPRKRSPASKKLASPSGKR